MQITKSYEENKNLGNYESVKIGLTIHTDKEVKSPEELEQLSGKLLTLAKQIVRKELEGIVLEKQGGTNG